MPGVKAPQPSTRPSLSRPSTLPGNITYPKPGNPATRPTLPGSGDRPATLPARPGIGNGEGAIGRPGNRPGQMPSRPNFGDRPGVGDRPNCLSNAKAQSANFPFCTIEPNVGVVNVPDPRLSKLESLVDPEKVIPATVEIVDIAGLVKGASKGEGLGNQFLANIRETDAILHVLRCFDNDNIVHVDGSVDPIRDKDTIDMELQLKDLETVEKKLEKVKRTAKTGNKEAQKEAAVLEQIKAHLEAGKSVRSLEVSNDDFELYIKPLQFITAKPVL